ncbi:MAG: SMP-30/gluconolactonase/LRE family protein [Acidimicrobiales bacterium]
MTAEIPSAWSPEALQLGEGARWVDGDLYLVDILAGRLLRAPARAGGALEEVWRIPGPLGAVAPVASRPGSWIAAAGAGIARVDPGGEHSSPRLTWLGRPELDAVVPMRMNDGVADPHGRFWAGSMAFDATADAGSLYRLDGDGTVHRVLGDITIPNGPAFTSDGATMYLADSARGVVDRWTVDPATGAVGDRERFVELRAGSPDGMTADDEGCLWVAVWGEAAVHRYRPDGSRAQTLDLPARQPASVCLGGSDGRRLFITSATEGLARPGPGDGLLYATTVATGGSAACAVRL